MRLVLRSNELDILKAIGYIIDVEEGDKLFHSWRVALLSKYIAEEKSSSLSLPLYIAGLLHDIGTFDISNRLAHHKNYMDDVGCEDIWIHPQKGAAIIASLEGFIPIAKAVLDHHERINGSGYPRGLSQNNISFESQILRIADKSAFLIDNDPNIKKEVFKEKLLKQIDKEFSKELFDCLMSAIDKDSLWNTIKDEALLTSANHNIFSELSLETDNSKMINKNYLSFFGRLLDAKHAYTEGHSRRVSYYSMLIALALNLSDMEIEKIEAAAFLHDIGKVGIPNSILDKKGPLNDDEFQIIKTHAGLSYDIVKGISVFENLADIVSADQEHWDGSGYPKGLKQKEIPIGSRIVFIADAFDAMTSNRSYHKAISVNKAIDELQRCADKDFDPEIISVASKILKGFQNSAVLSCYIDNE